MESSSNTMDNALLRLQQLKEAIVPAVPDLFFPQEHDKVRTILEQEVTIKTGPEDAPEWLSLDKGTNVYRLIETCKFARWTGIEWIFYVSRGEDDFFVRATDKSGVWEEVESEEPSTPISGS
jgi:hypothetical protein